MNITIIAEVHGQAGLIGTVNDAATPVLTSDASYATDTAGLATPIWNYVTSLQSANDRPEVRFQVKTANDTMDNTVPVDELQFTMGPDLLTSRGAIQTFLNREVLTSIRQYQLNQDVPGE